jgi:sugar phosphate isomerase/epimerase
MAARLVGVGHMTVLDVAPPDWVTLAASAGFGAVGIRAAAASPGEDRWPMDVGSPMLRETLLRLADTGLVVPDVEIIRLDAGTRPEAFRPLFETGAALGARFVNAIAFDPEPARAGDNAAALAALAAQHGLRLSLEAIPYSTVRNLDEAVAVLGSSTGGLIIDPLHLQRSGDGLSRVRVLDPDRVSYLQLCDAPRAAPSGLTRPARLPRNQAGADDDLAIEARAARLVPGDGELPLTDLTAMLPADLPVSAEVPNLALREELGTQEFLHRIRRGIDRVLRRAGSPPGHDRRASMSDVPAGTAGPS